MIETTGVSALAVHGRTKEQRPNDPNDTEAIKKIVAHVTKVPIIANGGSSNNRNSGINTYEGLKQFWKDSGASSIMVARRVLVGRTSWSLVSFSTGLQNGIRLCSDLKVKRR